VAPRALGERDVDGVVGGEVPSKLPYARDEDVVGVACGVEVHEVQ